MSPTERATVLEGIAGSAGVVIAPAVVVDGGPLRAPRRRVPAEAMAAEIERFERAVAGVQGELKTAGQRLREAGGDAAILDAYVLMVGDPTLAMAVRAEVEERGRSAEWAVTAASARLARQLRAVDDRYLRERSRDIEQLGEQVVRALRGGQGARLERCFEEASIVVAHELSPAEAAAMIHEPVVGFVTEVGTRTSHTAIMARALEIPAVLGVTDALERIDTADRLIVDGLRGQVVVHPTAAEVEQARLRASRYASLVEQLERAPSEPASTRDGARIQLLANVELPQEVGLAREHGAEGIGLYRTEFMYIGRTEPPDEQEQLAVLRTAMQAIGGKPVTLRTFDLGGDKFASSIELPDELNPLLGLRAVRLALAQPDLLLEQLRAMVRASAHGELRIMVPMVCGIEELRQVRGLLAQAHAQVRAAGEPCADHIPLGAMIEVPAAAIMADALAAEADFLSLGTNDLVQYALAVDRSNRALAHLASPFHPSVLRLIVGVMRAARAADCAVSVCGEMASEPLGALLLIGLGLRALSMESVAIPTVREAIRRSSLEELEQVAAEVLDRPTAAEVERCVAERLAPRLRDLLTGQPDGDADG